MTTVTPTNQISPNVKHDKSGPNSPKSLLPQGPTPNKLLSDKFDRIKLESAKMEPPASTSVNLKHEPGSYPPRDYYHGYTNHSKQHLLPPGGFKQPSHGSVIAPAAGSHHLSPGQQRHPSSGAYPSPHGPPPHHPPGSSDRPAPPSIYGDKPGYHSDRSPYPVSHNDRLPYHSSRAERPPYDKAYYSSSHEKPHYPTSSGDRPQYLGKPSDRPPYPSPYGDRPTNPGFYNDRLSIDNKVSLFYLLKVRNLYINLLGEFSRLLWPIRVDHINVSFPVFQDIHGG